MNQSFLRILDPLGSVLLGFAYKVTELNVFVVF